MTIRAYRGWTSPWREMERLRREMNRLFNEGLTGSRWDTAASYPAMNVWTDNNSAIVTAELPGFDMEELDISVEDDVLTLRGNRQPEELGEGATYHRRERRFGSFVRTFRLPFRVEAAKVEASYAKGVLKVFLPRAEADKPKKIAITAG
jgi:HSP20 family protein